MYFQIENTPEHIRKARRGKTVTKEAPTEECPRLILAPFSRPPQVVFDDVLIGSSCKKDLEVFNPTKQLQQITLGKALPAGLEIHLPGEWLELEPETCYCLAMVWTPTQPTAIRETIRFTNENRGRYDVNVVMKSVMNIKGKKQPKSLKISPGKVKKKTTPKKSPVAIYKKKAEIIYNSTKVKHSVNVVQSTQHTVYQTFNKENISRDDQSLNTYFDSKCPFDSPSGGDYYFNTSEIFSKPNKTNVLQETYDKSYSFVNDQVNVPINVLKVSNKQNCNTSASDIFDNLTFTPLKSLPAKSDKLDKGPRIVVSVNSDSEFDDSLKTSNKENQTHSIISITASQPPNKWLTVNHIENQFIETPTVPNKKHPNTSSPKELNSPNFSINTDFSRISDLSFFPQRCSTERKCFPKNETHEILDDKVNSDTYTKDSPNIPMEHHFNHMNKERPSHFFNREQPKICRQTLFREYQMQKDALNPYYDSPIGEWQNDHREVRSPARSVTPPLQSIPEESTQFSETQVLDKTDKQMATFTLDSTFDNPYERNAISTSRRQTWSKKSVGVEPDLWKVPVAYVRKSLKSKVPAKSKVSIGSKVSNVTSEGNNSNQNITINTIGNVYSQSSTVDPFLSSTYFYDEEAVDKIEEEFKRWLNCILTPPADLDSNVDKKIDVGKAWIENRNKEVPLAPTKEQVCSAYHNSHRLESLRRSARNLLMSPEMAQVFQKLNAQVEKKLIAVRTDRNLHLDVGLQKVIVELLLSYNPLWLRIGLEAIYGLILPLKSNSDIEGLTIFIVQRMFKNPHLKNKHSKSSAPNMLLPAYMEAIKKFTLKKFFMLVFFLDQAKQRKLIPHDPCLFCRNAICKESREIIIRFTRELIAGIGDITKHLRPLGYVVCHKQSYLDEYKYAVHNLALDIRDGVRLSKVMEIILMKNGLLNQLRTPAISRLQKIHNVQVAFNALKEANFVIVGDITATDVAEGHREKTLSLLWQIIHVFRAPLFEKAANVIQTWWRKKFEVIIEKRREEEKARLRLSSAASVIQCWWRRIQYNRQVEWRMQQITKATIVMQKYCRMWLCRTRLQRYKTSVLKIEEWFRSILLMREAKVTLRIMKFEREQLEHKCATTIQSYVRRWLCMQRYKLTISKIVIVQKFVRSFIQRKQYNQLKETIVYVQKKFRSKLLMRVEMQKLALQKRSVLKIQSYYRMIQQRRAYMRIKKSVQVFEDRYIALMKMRSERKKYVEMKKSVVALQALFRGRKCRKEYLMKRHSIIFLQRKIRAQHQMKEQRRFFLLYRNSALVLQKYMRSYLTMKKVRQLYVVKRKSAIVIQHFFRSYCLGKSHKLAYLRLRNATIVTQKRYRSLLLMRKVRNDYLKLRTATICIQNQYRAQVEMRKCRHNYLKLRNAAQTIQIRYRALANMREERSRYRTLQKSCLKIQNAYRAYVVGKRQRQHYIKQKEAALKLQNWYRSRKKVKIIREQYEKSKEACITIQRHYKAFIVGRQARREFFKIRTATVCIQRFYRSYIEMRTVRQEFIKMRTSTITIQKFYRTHLETKKQRAAYLKMKLAVLCIENTYTRYKEYQKTRQSYLQLKKVTINIQKRYRSKIAMRKQRNEYLILQRSVLMVQRKFRALISMKVERKSYLMLRSAVITVQERYRAQRQMHQERLRYITIQKACVSIQRFYKSYLLGKTQRHRFLLLKKSSIVIQMKYKALLAMKKQRHTYLAQRNAAIIIQRTLRANKLMLAVRKEYIKLVEACKTIQRAFRAMLAGRKQRAEYMKMKASAVVIQTHFRMFMEMRRVRDEYLQLRYSVITIQRRFRVKKLILTVRKNLAAKRIQTWYRSTRKRDVCYKKYLRMRQHVIIVQSIVRMKIQRKRFVETKAAALKIQQHYRRYKMTIMERQKYVHFRNCIIKLQSFTRAYIARKEYMRLRSAALIIQAAYRLKQRIKQRKLRQEAAALIVQKYVRGYLIRTWYRNYYDKVLLVQRTWRGNLKTRLIRSEYVKKRNIVLKLQSMARGYLVRREVRLKKDHIIQIREEKRQNWAATKIQALFRGHKARVQTYDRRVSVLRRRWREGALLSTQETIKERYEDALNVLCNYNILNVLRAFKSIELITEVYPMMYHENASSVVAYVFVYMSSANRSLSSVELLTSAASILVNFARYKVTGPMIYSRERTLNIMKFMLRFSNITPVLICIMSTYVWLFSKYDECRADMKEFLHIPENHKLMVSIKGNLERNRRIAINNNRNKYTPNLNKSTNANISMNMSSFGSNSNNLIMPALEPDYGIARIDQPKYFQDALQAVNCLFHTYNL